MATSFVSTTTVQEMAEQVYMNGSAAVAGDVEGPGHFFMVDWTGDDTVVICSEQQARIIGVICHTNSDGVKDYDFYDGAHKLSFVKDWDAIEEMVSTFYDDDDEDGDEFTEERLATESHCEMHDAPHVMGGLACELRTAEDQVG